MRGMPLFAGLFVVGVWTTVRLSILWSAPVTDRTDGKIAMASLFHSPVPSAFAETEQRRGLPDFITKQTERYPAFVIPMKVDTFGKKPLFEERAWFRKPISADKPSLPDNVLVFRPAPQKEMLFLRPKNQAQTENFAQLTNISGSPLAPNTESRGSKLSIYGYSFWRKGAGGSSVAAATAAQYGGSQSGVIATYRLSGANASGLFAMLRTAITPGKYAEQEVAAGLRWRPVNSVPVTLTAERRVRRDGQDQFALYAAGSADSAPLAGGFSASGYAQAGVIPGRRTDLFFDAGMRADRPVIDLAGIDLAAGIGAWAGGQRGAARLDAGPAVRSNFDIAGVKLQITADWRFKIAGNASPGSGPAVTISTGF
jgi:hypothetical protein